MKKNWVEASTLVVGDVVVFRRQKIELSVVRQEDGMVALTGSNENGVLVSTLCVEDELIVKVEDE